jgi:O-antigen ligase
MENPNVLGEFLLLMIPLSAVFMLKEKFTKLSKYFFTVAFLAGCLCMLLTQSRGCWLGLILCTALFVTFYNGKLWTLIPFVILALPFVMPEAMVARMMSVGNMEDSSTSYRVFIWRGTFKMLKDFWLGGIGMGEGAFRLVYPLYSYNGIIAPHSHNTFLQLLVEGGIGALLIFITIMAVFIKKISVSFSTAKKGSYIGLLALAIVSGVIGFLLQSMFDYTFYNYRMMAMFFMIIAIGMSFKYIEEDAE